jgi:hypothetical protein
MYILEVDRLHHEGKKFTIEKNQDYKPYVYELKKENMYNWWATIYVGMTGS